MIKLSRKGDYAIKTLIYMANDDSGNIFKIANISKKLQISESLLRRIISELEKSWIINTKKGRRWWIVIWKELSEISIFDILSATGEELWIRDCTKWVYCENQDFCDTSGIYNTLQKSFNWVLKLYTLDKIIKKS